MAKPDIIVDERATTVVKRLDVRTAADGPAKARIRPGGNGRLELGAESITETTDGGREGTDDRAWDIALSPNWATLNLGGGAAANSDGDIKLYDNPDGETARPRIHLSGGSGSSFESSRAHLTGQGSLTLGGPGPDDEDTSGRIELHDDGPDEGSRRVVISAGTAEEHVDGTTIDPERIDLGEHDSDGSYSRRPISLTTDASTTRSGGFVFFDDYFDRVPLGADDLEEMVGFQLGGTESRGLFLMPVGSEGLNFIAGGYMSLGAQDFPGEIGLKNADGDDAGRVRAGDSGLVLTDPDGNPALRIADDGTVHVTDGEVQPGP